MIRGDANYKTCEYDSTYVCGKGDGSVKKKFSTIAMVILMLLGFRVFGQLDAIMASLNFGAIVMLCVYVAAIFGIFGRKPWGNILCTIIGAIDIAMTALYVEGASRVGAVVVDLLLIYLALEDYRNINAGKEKENTTTLDKPSS